MSGDRDKKEIPEYTTFKQLKKASFQKVAKRLIEVRAQIESLDTERKQLITQVGVALALANAESVGFGDYMLVRQKTVTGAKFDRERFVKIAVADGADSEKLAAWMQLATTPAVETGETVQVRARKKERE